MLHTLFVLAVVLGFILWFLAAWWPNVAPAPVGPWGYSERAARFSFMVAAIIWATGAWSGR